MVLDFEFPVRRCFLCHRIELLLQPGTNRLNVHHANDNDIFTRVVIKTRNDESRKYPKIRQQGTVQE